MIDIPTMLPDLRRLVAVLAEDLLARSTTDAQIEAGLREAFRQIEKGGRTAQPFEVWRDDYLDQVAVAWVLACVFVRFLEDNRLVDDCWLAGEGERRGLAEDTHELYFRQHPHDTDREYLQHVFHQVAQLPAAHDLFAEGQTPLWAVGISGDAALSLVRFWRELEPATGKLRRTFEVESGDTRFLGDLYQELSERAKKKYALLQTPVFIEEFILDRTLSPALDEFGLEQVRLIDPTCGSGHFLLGTFARLFRLWCQREPNEIKAAQRALDGVWGVDINPFAVAIARFRLLVAALQGCGIRRLKEAPGWKIHLATGDSLLMGSRWNRLGDVEKSQTWLATDEGSWAPEIYACEDRQAIQEVLGQQYHVVVGNPPYITPKDARLNAAYRERYATCHRQYSLGVPFTERFFELCLPRGDQPAGYVGMITTNSFMKREFGKKLIEEFFPKVDLTHVIDTSGAYIPGHGTPTVILFGRQRRPVGDTVRAVLGIKGEPSTPEDPSQGLVWQSILRQIDTAGAQDEFTSTADVPRTTFASHPWSIGGGGAADLKERLEDSSDSTLEAAVTSIGFMCITKQDEVFCQPRQVFFRTQCEVGQIRPFGIGEEIRDWGQSECDWVIYPFDQRVQLLSPNELPCVLKFIWPYKTILEDRKVFGGQNYREAGKPWYDYGQIPPDRQSTPLSIAFAFVASHNHFVLDRGGKVFNRSAPIIKLPPEATEDDHLALLGLLNSSTACFWMKQSLHDKGGGGIGGGLATEYWEHFFEFTGTGLLRFPVADERPLDLAARLDRLGQNYHVLTPESLVANQRPTSQALLHARRTADQLRGQMIALQEELDWQCYQLYGLLGDDLRYPGDDLPELKLGERAFEIVLARQLARGELTTSWFERHGSQPITEIPAHWPAGYRQLVARRIEIIETNPEINLVERPEYKRRWNTEPWEDQEHRALEHWLLDRLETTRYWPDPQTTEPRLQSTAQLADQASSDREFLEVAALYRGRPDFDLAALVAELVTGESVPFLPVLRYKPAGLRKRQLWERTWDLQRQEDAGENVGTIPVPPKYASADFQKTDYWRLRGKLDVPKERWVSYPHCSTAADPSPVVGWAGWNHLQQALALVAYYDARRREGWDAQRLVPLLAGLDQLLPWIHQWHPQVDPEFGETAGRSFQTMLEQDAHELGLTREEIRSWTPPEKKGGRRRAKG